MTDLDAIRPMTDGPNVHHYKTFTRGTAFVVITIDYVGGDRHTFHVPAEVVNDIEHGVPAMTWRGRLRRWFR